MAFVDDPAENSAEVTKGVWLLTKEDEAANSGDVPRVVAAEKLFRSLPEDVQEVSRQRLEKGFGGEGHRLGESTFKDDEERDRHRKAAYEKAQARYKSGEAPFGGPVDDSKAFSGSTAEERSPSPDPAAFTGEGHQTSDWPLENDQERESERKEAMTTAQARYRAGLAPFEGEMDPSRLPSAPRTQEPSSSPPRVPSDVDSAIRGRRAFSSGATDAEVDPVGHIEDNLIPSDPNHGTMKSGVRSRRQFSSGASDEYVDVKAARSAYKKQVASTIRLYRSEQPKAVGELQRLWNWINAEIDDDPEELQHRARQLPRIEELLTTIEEAHTATETRRKDAEQKRIQDLLADIGKLSAEVGVIFKANFDLLSREEQWKREYDGAAEYLRVIAGNPASQTEDNLGPLQTTWQNIQRTAKTTVASVTSSSTGAVKIGYDPFDPTDMATIYGYYQQTGGTAPHGQVVTVCQEGIKHGGTYTYLGQSYDMFHDSHGPIEGNSDKSRTAWKILVKGKLQVVGIGHHIPGGAKYQAVFPYSTDPTVQKYGPSPDITDHRK